MHSGTRSKTTLETTCFAALKKKKKNKNAEILPALGPRFRWRQAQRKTYFGCFFSSRCLFFSSFSASNIIGDNVKQYTALKTEPGSPLFFAPRLR